MSRTPEVTAAELTRRLSADRALIERALAAELAPDPEVPRRLGDAMRYAVLGPGKRIRPTLCLEGFSAAGGRDRRRVLPFCCGIEMIHAFSLVHDDLPSMDDDDFRRGRPSLHRRYDEATAILAADALFARAFELLSRSGGSERDRLAAIALVCRAVGPAGMTGGQMLDIGSARDAGPRRLRRLQQKKTAEFMAAALVSGAVLAGAGGAVRGRLHRAGLALGSLFQITDDLLDSVQPSDDRRATMVARYGRAGARRRAEAEAAEAGRLLAALGPGYRLLAAFPGMFLNRAS